MTEQSITISARALVTLLDAVSPYADSTGYLPVLNNVRIESRGTHLLAIATDRYRLAIQRLAAGEEPWPEFGVNVPLRAIRSIKSVFKPMRGVETDLVLTLADDRLTAFSGLRETLAVKPGPTAADPILVYAGEDFIGAVMPRKRLEGSATGDDLSDWTDLLTVPEKPVAKKPARKTAKKAVA